MLRAGAEESGLQGPESQDFSSLTRAREGSRGCLILLLGMPLGDKTECGDGRLRGAHEATANLKASDQPQNHLSPGDWWDY